MTFYRDFCDDGSYSPFGYEDLYGFGGLNGYRFGSPYGYFRDQYRYGSPYGYRSFGSLYGNRGLIGYGGCYGFGDSYGFGYGYPFSSRFGNRYSY
ncbi:scale keratin-like [Grus americana]|nr:scale keratin-like [Grus americana]